MRGDVVVVGGGIAGLSAAALLAQRGYAITLLEEKPRLGGRLAPKEGPLGSPAFALLREGRRNGLARVFHHLGEALPLCALDTPRVALGGEWERVPERPRDLVRTRFLGLHGAREWWEAWRSLHREPLESLRGESLLGALGPFASEEAETLLAVSAGLHGGVADVDRASAERVAEMVRSRKGARPRWAVPSGSWDTVVERLRDRLLAAGGSVRVATRATRIDGTAPRFRLQTSAGELEARAIVLAVPPVEASTIASSVLPRALTSSLRTLQPVTGYRLDVTLRRPPTDLACLLATPEPFSFGYVPSNVDVGAAEEGKARLSWFFPLPAHRMLDASFLEASRHLLHGLLAGLLPGIWSDAVSSRLEPCSAANAAPIVGQDRDALPSVDTGVSGIVLAGDATRTEGSGLEAAARSALEAVEVLEEQWTGVRAVREAREPDASA